MKKRIKTIGDTEDYWYPGKVILTQRTLKTQRIK
jgi:hypothetical protein